MGISLTTTTTTKRSKVLTTKNGALQEKIKFKTVALFSQSESKKEAAIP
jgi:hypothetical protein